MRALKASFCAAAVAMFCCATALACFCAALDCIIEPPIEVAALTAARPIETGSHMAHPHAEVRLGSVPVSPALTAWLIEPALIPCNRLLPLVIALAKMFPRVETVGTAWKLDAVSPAVFDTPEIAERWVSSAELTSWIVLPAIGEPMLCELATCCRRFDLALATCCCNWAAALVACA